jgi:tRNA G18 (ribose-2'-O)-methylase SpoU
MLKLNASQLRNHQPSETEIQQVRASRRELYFILDNIYDTYNIGGLFRLADAVGVKTVFLCGRTECPPNSRIFKSAVGTENWVDWQYHSSTVEAISKLRESFSEEMSSHTSLQIVAIEQAVNAIPLTQAKLNLPLALVLGDETAGVSISALDLCDRTIEIPMFGINKSLNVIVSAAMVLGKLI